MRNNLYQEVEYILNEIDTMMWEKTGKEMISLQWKLGFALKEINERDMLEVSHELSEWFQVNPSFFLDAYNLYKEYPVLDNAMRCAA